MRSRRRSPRTGASTLRSTPRASTVSTASASPTPRWRTGTGSSRWTSPASFSCMRYELPEIVKAGGGAIVNCASVAGLRAAPKVSAYTAAKHGVVGLTKAAAREYAASGCGSTPSARARSTRRCSDSPWASSSISSIATNPSRRLADASEIASGRGVALRGRTRLSHRRSDHRRRRSQRMTTTVLECASGGSPQRSTPTRGEDRHRWICRSRMSSSSAS